MFQTWFARLSVGWVAYKILNPTIQHPYHRKEEGEAVLKIGHGETVTVCCCCFIYVEKLSFQINLSKSLGEGADTS